MREGRKRAWQEQDLLETSIGRSRSLCRTSGRNLLLGDWCHQLETLGTSPMERPVIFFQFQRSARNHTLVGQVSSRATGSLLDRARSEQRERVLPGYYQMNWQSLLMPQTGPAAVQKMAKQRQMVILEIPIIAAYCHHDMPIVEATAVCFYPSRPEGAVWSPEDFSEVQKFVEEYMSAFQLCLCLNPSCSAHAVSDKFKAANGQHLTVDGMIEKFQMQERHVRRARLMLKHPAVHLPLRFSLSFKIPRIHVDAGGEARMWEPKEGTMSRQEHIAQGTELQTQKKKGKNSSICSTS